MPKNTKIEYYTAEKPAKKINKLEKLAGLYKELKAATSDINEGDLSLDELAENLSKDDVNSNVGVKAMIVSLLTPIALYLPFSQLPPVYNPGLYVGGMIGIVGFFMSALFASGAIFQKYETKNLLNMPFGIGNGLKKIAKKNYESKKEYLSKEMAQIRLAASNLVYKSLLK